MHIVHTGWIFLGLNYPSALYTDPVCSLGRAGSGRKDCRPCWGLRCVRDLMMSVVHGKPKVPHRDDICGGSNRGTAQENIVMFLLFGRGGPGAAGAEGTARGGGALLHLCPLLPVRAMDIGALGSCRYCLEGGCLRVW
ncbi:hypothetical protein E2C01_094228 [Portunus trituberculatus]|uniref:Uncharacterized protein n=1 Tax=Portunus trituberculatus TaxID=210409 RepID=A0A5B7JRW5_PORTR|nr:hypothetical protein [Portunus trituberculatus]